MSKTSTSRVIAPCANARASRSAKVREQEICGRVDQHAPPVITTMRLSQFHIGLDFWCGGKRWRCIDVGSMVPRTQSRNKYSMRTA